MALRQLRRRAARQTAAAAAILLVQVAAVACSSASSSWPDAGYRILPAGRVAAAAELTRSVGVGVHWNYPDTPYGSDYSTVRKLLVDSGIRHVRGDVDRAGDLHDAGIQTTVTVDAADDGTGTPASQWDAIAPLARSGAVDAVEGPNEPDIFWVNGGWTYQGQPFPKGVVAWQRDLYALVKSDPTTAGVQVIGPSLGRNYWGTSNPFTAGELEPYVDLGNFHPYPGGNPYTDPTTYAGIDRYYANSDFPTVTLDQHPINLKTYAPPFGNRPMAVTETGYSTGALGQSEETQAVYLPRVFLEYFRLGFPRTFAYELVDEFADPTGSNREAHFGLLRHDLTPKPAYYAVQSLMSAVTGGSTTGVARAKAIDYQLEVRMPNGYDPAAVHHLVLRRPDGSTVIFVWHEVSRSDLAPLQYHPPQPIREVQQPLVDVKLRTPNAGVQTARVIGEDGMMHDLQMAHDRDVSSFKLGDTVAVIELAT